MPNNDYIPLPTEPPVQLDTEYEEQETPKPRPPRQASGPTVLQTTDPRFNPPSPSPLKRAALLLFVLCLFWFALKLRTAKPPRPLTAPATERYLPGMQPIPLSDSRASGTPQISIIVPLPVAKGPRTRGRGLGARNICLLGGMKPCPGPNYVPYSITLSKSYQTSMLSLGDYTPPSPLVFPSQLSINLPFFVTWPCTFCLVVTSMPQLVEPSCAVPCILKYF